MKFIDNLEQKIGKYAIKNLMVYLIALYIIGFIINLVNPEFYINYLSLNAERILHGEVWRIITFLCYPPNTSIIWFLLLTFVYFSLGRTLETIWGAFRFNLYIFIGIFANVIAAIIIYLIWDQVMLLTASQLYLTMLLGMAATFPDMKFYLYFILPIKAKWLGIVYGGILLYQVISSAVNGYWPNVVAIVLSVINFFFFILVIKKPSRAGGYSGMYGNTRSSGSGVFGTRFGGSSSSTNSSSNRSRDNVYKMNRNSGERTFSGVKPVRHRCAVCGITDVDNPQMEFRYCSKCNGAYEYCKDHLYTHEHVQ